MSTIDIIVLVLGVILTILNIWERVSLAKDKATSPHRQNEERIAKLEFEVADIQRMLRNDKERIDELEQGTKIIIKSMSALLSHGIDGNNEEEMKSARKELNEFLIEK